ncbi:MAG TPA: [FeFe] hydrogenase H-cluster maturation GTPase HydF, partial [Anaerohalosphaeraceae bacterium]|nr:[FeFe] hydrogenase H-cluster maturation GTPase HydF [Anaerohalosphaeraceae bacterium]
MTRSTPKGFRLHIGLFGRRNVGKSMLLNAITCQQVSIVSRQPGTTTDPVEKPMELPPLGPVLFIDTAGIDDAGALGQVRVDKTRQAFDRTDLGLIVSDGTWGQFEETILLELKKRSIPAIAVFNKSDVQPPLPQTLKSLAGRQISCIQTAAFSGDGIDALRQALLDQAPANFIDNPVIAADLVGPGDVVILVIPIDKEAPKGRIILPQAQTLRDLLDHRILCMVTPQMELAAALARLKSPPSLVVTDSQIFEQVAALIPPQVKMTGFSVLYSRLKGDLTTQALGTLAVEDLKPGDRVLVAEACTHHPIEDDIGRVKIPNWLSRHVGGALQFTTMQGQDFPDDLTS